MGITEKNQRCRDPGREPVFGPVGVEINSVEQLRDLYSDYLPVDLLREVRDSLSLELHELVVVDRGDRVLSERNPGGNPKGIPEVGVNTFEVVANDGKKLSASAGLASKHTNHHATVGCLRDHQSSAIFAGQHDTGTPALLPSAEYV